MALLRSALLERAGFRHGWPERATADAELLAALGAERVVQVVQVHGARAVHAAQALELPGEQADAVVALPGPRAVAVGVRVADCVPVLLAHPGSGSVAAVHAGWRGVVAGVVPAAASEMPRGGLVAAIGPCIGACCFEVGADVAGQIERASHGAPVVAERRGDKAYVDLRAAVRAQLRALGVDDARIEDVPGCTRHEARFHSFRRDGKNSGRMLAAIASRPREATS
jgi:YfiH family protein